MNARTGAGLAVASAFFALALTSPAAFAARPPRCLGAEHPEVPQAKPLVIAGTGLRVEVCALAEDARGRFPSRLELRKGRARLAAFTYDADPTGGYVSRLGLAAKNDRFVAISFDAAETCDDIVFFDLRLGRAAGHARCDDAKPRCRVTRLDSDRLCRAEVRCDDPNSTAAPPAQPAVFTTLNLCDPKSPPIE